MTPAHDPAVPGASPGRPAAADDGVPASEERLPPSPPLREPLQPPAKGRWEHPRGRGPAVLVPVVYGVGVAAEAAAETVIEQLAPWVRTGLFGVEEVTPAVLDVHGLVIVLSSDVGGRQKPLFRELRLIGEQLRAARPLTSADGFRPGSSHWHRASTLWVLYTDEALGDPDARALVEMACASYVYTPGVPFTDDLLEIYEPGVAQARRRRDPIEAATMTNWNWLGTWGIHDVAFATTIKKAIEARCRELDDPGSPKMARPIPGVEMNRLELVLFAPERKPPPDPALTPEEQKKEETNFVATGARAVRLHLTKLTQTYAGTDTPFQVPERYRTAKNKQSVYRRLYLALRAVTEDS